MYSLVSPSELAAALVRHPSAVEVTDILDRALRIDRVELRRLSLVYRDDARRREAWGRVASLAGLAATADGPRVGVGAAPAAVAGGVDEGLAGAALDLGMLLDFVREEILGWTREQVGDLVVEPHPGGTTAVADALGVAWAGPGLPLADRARLRLPWLTLYGEVPTVAGPDDLGPHGVAMRELLDLLAAATPETLVELGEAYRLQAPPRPSGVRPWDVAMRRACQSAFVTGKVRQVAAAQFAAVRAQLLPGAPAGLPGTPTGEAVAQAVAGTVQAVALRDTLDPVVFRFLVFAWETTLGTVPA